MNKLNHNLMYNTPSLDQYPPWPIPPSIPPSIHPIPSHPIKNRQMNNSEGTCRLAGYLAAQGHRGAEHTAVGECRRIPRPVQPIRRHMHVILGLIAQCHRCVVVTLQHTGNLHISQGRGICEVRYPSARHAHDRDRQRHEQGR